MQLTTHTSTQELHRESPLDRLRATRLDLTRQSAVAFSAFAIVGLHIADDAFVQPEPGTSALDHLPGGLVQLAALGLAAAAYRRGRAGVRSEPWEHWEPWEHCR